MTTSDRGAKTAWLTIQRAALYAYLGCTVLFLVYALGFLTQSYLFYAYGDKGLSDFYRAMQAANTALLRDAIIACILAVVLFLLELHRHAAGIVTLVAVMAVSAVTAYFAVSALVSTVTLSAAYSALDFSSLNRYIERGTIAFTPSTAVYTLGTILAALFAVTAVFLAVTVTKNAFTVVDSGAKTEGGSNG